MRQKVHKPHQDPAGTPASGHLLSNTILFGRFLRGLGFDVNPDVMITLIQALEFIRLDHREDYYLTARCVLVKNKSDLELFDKAFELFWCKPLSLLSLAGQRSGRNPSEKRGRGQEALLTLSPAETTNPDDNGEGEGRLKQYSANELLRQKDFAELSSTEEAAVLNMIAAFSWQPGQRRTRRMKGGKGSTVDMHRTLRSNLRYGGELLTWSMRVPKTKTRRLVVLADISGSMEIYSRLFLHYIYGLNRGLQQHVETFVFGTRLTRITQQLRDRDIHRALRNVTQIVPDWSGGTRIGQTLKQFNKEWARRVLNQGAVVLLISDGWDRGNPQLLEAEMRRLQLSCHRLIWLNPLLGSDDYEPLTRGLVASLPFVDDFLPAHNAVSLENLMVLLHRLDNRRPFRRQHPANSTGANLMSG